MRREEIVGQRFPVGEMQHVEIAAGEHGELGFERVRCVRVARDRDDETRVRAAVSASASASEEPCGAFQ